MAAEAKLIKLGPIALKSIIGKWVGEGSTIKVTTSMYFEYILINASTYIHNIKDFKYDEEIEITDNGQPFLFYKSQTWIKGNKNKPMHSESGYIRFPSEKGIDLVVSQCTGITEISSGDISMIDNDDKNKSEQKENQNESKQKSFTITLSSNSIGRVSTAKDPKVTQVERIYKYNLTEDTLSYEISMANTKTPELTKHLFGSFKRQK